MAPISMKLTSPTPSHKLVIRIAGDSGDGIQLTGQQLASVLGAWGNEVHTFPDFPAEIRAPAGTLGGVSGFQLQVAKGPIFTPGDELDILVAMNPAALEKNKHHLKTGGLLLINEDAFVEKEWKKAGFQEHPLKSPPCNGFQCLSITMTTYTLKALKSNPLSISQKKKCKNMFVLGFLTWLLDKDLYDNEQWLKTKFKSKEEVIEATITTLQAGYAFASQTLDHPFHIQQTVALRPGEYRQVTGNDALALACATAATFSPRGVFVAGYPITPASTFLHKVAKQQGFGIKTFQAEDEIAAISAALGAAYGGDIAITSTSGPGFDLKSEALGLSVMAELPLVVINVQRAGPSTGMPTKLEQSDLLTALYGRHGESPVVILAPATPSENYYYLLKAIVLSQQYMTPVILLSDAYLATSTEPWCISSLNQWPFMACLKDPSSSLYKPWRTPGKPNDEYCLGGLEKDKITGHVSYEGHNHEAMVKYRQEKVAKVAEAYEPSTVIGKSSGKVLVLGWGSTYGAIRSAVTQLMDQGKSIAHLHLRYLNPLPCDLRNILASYETIIVPELNQGQLSQLIQQQYLVPVIPFNKIQGQPFLVQELITMLETHCGS